jgi:hypothetical protein
VACVDACSGVQTITSRLHTNISLSKKRKLAEAELYKLPNTLTPYGTVCHTSLVRGKNGELEIYHVNPFAMLQHATQSFSMFRDFFAKVVRGSPHGRIDLVYYLDRCTPGNVRRPDDGRSAQCIYWTVLQFPTWFKSRQNGWIPFAYVSVAGQKHVDLNDSALVRFLVRTFDSNDAQLAFSKGFGVPGPGDDILIVRASGQLIVADWDQHVKTFNLKGYHGSVPCGICKNIVGRCEYFEDEYLVHLHSSDYGRFDKHTPASFRELTERIKHIADHGTPSALLAEQQYTGITYDPEGLL